MGSPFYASSSDCFGRRTICSLQYDRRFKVWANHLGVVDLELTFPDGSKASYTNLSTIAANLILHFQDRREWTLKDLAKEAGLDPEITRKKMMFWFGEGVVTENRHVELYTIANQAPSGLGTGEDEFLDDQEDDMDVEAAEKDLLQAEQDKAQSDFISTMLTNLGESSIDMIHRNLQLFAAALPHGYDRTEQELEVFLESLVIKGFLEKVDDKFSLPESSRS